MARDARAYFVITNEFPRSRKIRGLSDTAFRLLIELIADCNQYRTDGEITDRELNARGPKAAKELLENGNVERAGKGVYQIHDYLLHQKSREELEVLSRNRSQAAKLGNHTQHHLGKGVRKDDCPYCLKAA